MSIKDIDKNAIEVQIECIQDSIRDIQTEMNDLMNLVRSIEIDEE